MLDYLWRPTITFSIHVSFIKSGDSNNTPSTCSKQLPYGFLLLCYVSNFVLQYYTLYQYLQNCTDTKPGQSRHNPHVLQRLYERQLPARLHAFLQSKYCSSVTDSSKFIRQTNEYILNSGTVNHITQYNICTTIRMVCYFV